jgi:hypothetical protein
MRQRGDHHIKADLHLAGEQVGDHWRAAAIGDMHHVDAGHLLEQLASEMRGGADAERSHGDLAGIRVGVVNQLGNRFGREKRMCNQDHGIGDKAGDRRDAVLQRGWVRRDFRVHQRGAAVVEQCVPVRR